MRDNGKEDARKRGGGGWINDGGRSDGTLRYMYAHTVHDYFCNYVHVTRTGGKQLVVNQDTKRTHVHKCR